VLNAGLLVALVKIRDENNISRLFLTMILLCSFSATMQFVLQHYDEGLRAQASTRNACAWQKPAPNQSLLWCVAFQTLLKDTRDIYEAIQTLEALAYLDKRLKISVYRQTVILCTQNADGLFHLQESFKRQKIVLSCLVSNKIENQHPSESHLAIRPKNSAVVVAKCQQTADIKT